MSKEEKPGLKDILKLSKLERFVMEYFLKHISVGEITATIEMREEIKRLGDRELVPDLDDVVIEVEIGKTLGRLVRKGFLEYSSGCYNLAPQLREELKSKLGGLRPGYPKKLEDLVRPI